MIGAGVAGLVAARRLAQAGAHVTVWEAEDRVGGQVHTVEVAPGTRLDLGAEALHLAAPGVADLVAELGLAGTMVVAAPGSSRLVTPRGLRPLPAGVGPAGPSRLGPVVRSRTLEGRGERGLEVEADGEEHLGDQLLLRGEVVHDDAVVDAEALGHPAVGDLAEPAVERGGQRALEDLVAGVAGSHRPLTVVVATNTVS